jgi:hypothetical protein
MALRHALGSSVRCPWKTGIFSLENFASQKGKLVHEIAARDVENSVDFFLGKG